MFVFGDRNNGFYAFLIPTKDKSVFGHSTIIQENQEKVNGDFTKLNSKKD
jgi:hypothetical protein